jgi:replicative DNA helicase
MIELPYVRDVLSGCLRDTRFLSSCASLLKPEDFIGETEQNTFRSLRNFFLKYKRSPTLEEFLAFTKDKDAELQYQLVKDDPKLGVDFLSDKVIDFARHLALSKAIVDSVDLVESGKYADVETLVRNALLVGAKADVGIDFFSTVADRLLTPDRQTISTGIRELDTLLRGGLGRGELTSILGITGGGKSMALTQFGRGALISGVDVVEYTLELSDNAVAARYDAAIAGVPYARTRDYYGQVVTKVGKFRKMAGGATLLIKEYPTRSASVNDIRAHLRSAQAFVKPGLVIVDYADVLRPSEHMDKRYESLGIIYEDLRGLAMEFDVAVATASQTNRDALDSAWVDIDNVSESFGKIMVSDVVLAINRTREDAARNQARVGVIKNRTGPLGTITIRTKYENAIFATAEEVPQDEIVEQQPRRGGFHARV